MSLFRETLKKKIKEELAKVKKRTSFVRSKTLDDMARAFGVTRRSGELDNELFARLQDIPEFKEKVDELLFERYQNLDERVQRVENNPVPLSFMDELKKL